MSLSFRIVLVSSSVFSLPAMAQTVGVASAASGEPRGTPPAQNERILRVGIDVFANERVRTGANDRAHLVFNDGSALSVGVNSELTIDRFVYDPTTREGDLGLQRVARRLPLRRRRDQQEERGQGHGALGQHRHPRRHRHHQHRHRRLGDRHLPLWRLGHRQQRGRHAEGHASRLADLRALWRRAVPADRPAAGRLQAYLGLFEKQQGTGNTVSPGDQAQLDALVTALNTQVLPRTGTGPGLQTWLTYLQLLSMQAITTTTPTTRQASRVR